MILRVLLVSAGFGVGMALIYLAGTVLYSLWGERRGLARA